MTITGHSVVPMATGLIDGIPKNVRAKYRFRCRYSQYMSMGRSNGDECPRTLKPVQAGGLQFGGLAKTVTWAGDDHDALLVS